MGYDALIYHHHTATDKGAMMAICNYCEQEYADERADAGYDYCLDEYCQALGLDKSKREFRKEYTPALLHKCNYFWVHKSDLPNIGVKK